MSLSVSKIAKDNDILFEFHANYFYVKSHVSETTLLDGNIIIGLYAFYLIMLPNTPTCYNYNFVSLKKYCMAC